MSLSLRISLIIIAAAMLTLIGLSVAAISVREQHQVNNWGPLVAPLILRWSGNILRSDDPRHVVHEIHEDAGIDVAAHFRGQVFSDGDELPSPRWLQKRQPVKRGFTRHLPNELSLYRIGKRYFVLHRLPRAQIVYGLGRRHLPLSWVDHLQFVAGSFGALAVLFGTVVWLTRRTLRPLAKVSAEMESFVQTSAATPSGKGSNNEIKRVADSYAAMRRRVEAQISAKEDLLRDVSHEIRSPLARIRLRIELMDDAEARDALAADVAEIDSLAQDLLDRAYLSADQPLADIELLDLAEQARLAIAAQAQAQENIKLTTPGEQVRVKGNAKLLRRAITNLLVNSLKYSRLAEGSISVEVSAEGDTAVIAVADDGEQLDEEVVAKLFEPFYRPDSSRARKTGGHGLGLALVRSIATSHQGAANASSPGEGGLRVEIRLPRALSP